MVGNDIARLCIEHYTKTLTKKGKPKENEWTVLSAFVLEQAADEGERFMVVAMGTGSKCLGKSLMSKSGDVVNDSHAEIVARRALLRFMLEDMQRLKAGNKGLMLEKVADKYALKTGMKLHFFSTAMPCGDASIIPMTTLVYDARKHKQEHFDDNQPVKHRKFSDNNCLPSEVCDPLTDRAETLEDTTNNIVTKVDSHTIGNTTVSTADNARVRNHSDDVTVRGVHNADSPGDDVTVRDVHRTGAKCVAGEAADPHGDGPGYHVTGALRTKPGRGERTLSMSCSDKMARWCMLGVQGALLARLLAAPVYIDSVIINSAVFDEKALHRALIGRFTSTCDVEFPACYRQHTPKFLQSDVTFPHAKSNDSQHPCASAISWYRTSVSITTGCQEAIVGGRRQGVTAKNKNNPITRNLTYEEAKSGSRDYTTAWDALRTTVFRNWVRTPRDYNDFTLAGPGRDCDIQTAN